MSKTEAVRFISEYLPHHSELKQTIVQGKELDFATRLARAAVEAGYDFTEAELLETLRQTRGNELSESELEAVAGGTDVDLKMLAEKVVNDVLTDLGNLQREAKKLNDYYKKIY